MSNPLMQILRHGESRGNIGINERNPGLTDKGKEQASKVSGFASLVITSNLRRAKETLSNSNIKYNNLIETDLCREIKQGHVNDYMENEEIVNETNKDLTDRINKLCEFLCEESKKHDTILIISHGIFINCFLNLNKNGLQTIYNCQCLNFNLVHRAQIKN